MLMNKGLNIGLIVLLLASFMVGGVSGESDSNEELSDANIRILGIGTSEKSEFVVQKLDLMVSIELNRKIMEGDFDQYKISNGVIEASDRESKREVLFQRVTEIEIESIDLIDEFKQVRLKWNDGLIGTDQLYRELILISTKSDVLKSALDHVENETDGISQIGLSGKIRSIEEGLIPLTGPIRTHMISMASGESKSEEICVNSSSNGLSLSIIKGTQYIREAYRGDQQSVLGVGGISLDEASERTAELYPTAYDPRMSQQTGIMGEGRGYRIEIGFKSGSLTSYLDGETQNVFYEIQERKLGALTPGLIMEVDGGDTSIIVERGFEGGPMKVIVYDEITQKTVPAEFRIGEDRVVNINRGGKWIIAPVEISEAKIIRDGREIVFEIYPTAQKKVKIKNKE